MALLSMRAPQHTHVVHAHPETVVLLVLQHCLHTRPGGTCSWALTVPKHPAAQAGKAFVLHKGKLRHVVFPIRRWP